MFNQLEICNLALSHLGMNEIEDITDANPSAETCNRLWLPTLYDAYREAKFPFCTYTAELTTSTATVLGWDYTFGYPALAAVVWYVFDEGSADKKHEQEFEVQMALDGTAASKIICSNFAECSAEYTYITTDTTLFDPKFTLAYSYKLAGNMAHHLIGDADKGLKLMEMATHLMSEAKRINSIEKRKKPGQTSGYVTSRG